MCSITFVTRICLFDLVQTVNQLENLPNEGTVLTFLAIPLLF
jgi:hypothetical protein